MAPDLKTAMEAYPGKTRPTFISKRTCLGGVSLASPS